MTAADDGKKQGVITAYASIAPAYDRIGPPVFAHFGERLVEHACLPEGVRVLDVAAGRGAVLFPAARRVGDSGVVVGIDLTPAMVAATTADIARQGVRNAQMRRGCKLCRRMPPEADEKSRQGADAVT